MRERKESACKTLIECFWKHFKMKMSYIDRTNSFDPDQAQQTSTGPEGERSVRLKKCLGQKQQQRYSACKELRQKRCYIWNTRIRAGYMT